MSVVTPVEKPPEIGPGHKEEMMPVMTLATLPVRLQEMVPVQVPIKRAMRPPNPEGSDMGEGLGSALPVGSDTSPSSEMPAVE